MTEVEREARVAQLYDASDTSENLREFFTLMLGG